MQKQQRIDIANNIVTPAATERSNNVIATRAGCNQCNHASANNGLEHDICDPASMHFNILLLSASSRFNIGTNFKLGITGGQGFWIRDTLDSIPFLFVDWAIEIPHKNGIVARTYIKARNEAKYFGR